MAFRELATSAERSVVPNLATEDRLFVNDAQPPQYVLVRPDSENTEEGMVINIDGVWNPERLNETLVFTGQDSMDRATYDAYVANREQHPYASLEIHPQGLDTEVVVHAAVELIFRNAITKG